MSVFVGVGFRVGLCVWVHVFLELFFNMICLFVSYILYDTFFISYHTLSSILKFYDDLLCKITKIYWRYNMWNTSPSSLLSHLPSSIRILS